ncbi:hypothetical protein PHLGIDRAFT_25906 [Phlebiopsis gigantea 11061_1 CR5-6]|uniref:Uncharacterized protein n=1 Tax=Phlebiopsis gigantea (strain 11061_1 CR5-6) TaxID=745531 RepID=A0A0C3RTA1_PHLG1|nr:hypothetical protein PHLGIDRAFT_25906 [Phlebiopsis gigantea 11061_1 CR5-6]
MVSLRRTLAVITPVTHVHTNKPLPPLNMTYYLDQLVDHTSPGLGTFKQRYWHTWEWYKSEGPIILFTPGEGFTGYLVNKSLNGQIAQQESGATIVLEHCYYGLSAPAVNISAQNLNYSSALTGSTIVNNSWQYFEPIRTHMPQNCSADVEAVISHIDAVFTSGPQSEIGELWPRSGPVRNNMWDWQPETGPNATFFQFCDALEVKNQVSSPASGWGVDHALPAWGDFWKQGYLANLCQGSDVQTCLGTYDHSNPLFTDVSIGNDYRSWSWIEAAPTGHPTVVTRFAQPAYDERTCPYFFLSPNVANTTSAYKGWNVRVDRLFFANGIRECDATVSADGSNIQSTPKQPIAVDDGFRTSNC